MYKLLCLYSNCNCRARHLMNDLKMLLPHSKAGTFVHSCVNSLIVRVHVPDSGIYFDHLKYTFMSYQ